MEPENPGLEIAKAMAGEMGKESVNKFANIIRGLFPFWGLKRTAVDTYIREIEKSNMSPEAKMFAIANTKKTYREIKNQSAIIDIACSAISNNSGAGGDKLPDSDNELILRLIDSGKFVSDEELQLLWGNVLAGEFERPGSTPKNIVRILSELSKENADTFSKLCSLRVDILLDTGNDIENGGFALMVNVPSLYLDKMGIRTNTCQELQNLGLINFATIGNYYMPINSAAFPYVHIVSGCDVITVHNNGKDFPNGNIALTNVGSYIARFVPRQHNSHHTDEIIHLFGKNAIELSQTPGIRIIEATEAGIGMEYSFERLPIDPLQIQEQL